MDAANRNLSVAKLVEALGGPAAVGRALTLATPVVANWSYRGQLPARHHLALWRLAQHAGLDWRPPGAEGLTLPPASPVHETFVNEPVQAKSAA